MKLYKDLTNLILKYTYGFCESCENKNHYIDLHIDQVCHAGSLICIDCGWEICSICDCKFNRLTQIDCAHIDHYGMLCNDCYCSFEQCEQCFTLTFENILCSTCGLQCCMGCKEEDGLMCFACEQLMELFEEMIEVIEGGN